MVKTLGYVGRGLAIGLSDDEQSYYQVFWLMGRGDDSRNRVISIDQDNFLEVEAHEGEVEDPEIRLYHAMKHHKNVHIVTNGRQTDNLFNNLKYNQPLDDIDFEPDKPNYTPRICGLLDTSNVLYAYQISISKTHHNNPNFPIKHLYSYEKPIPGQGHMITTYTGDGNPLPSFQGEPLLVPIYDTLNVNLDMFKRLLNNEHLVSLAIKQINPDTRSIEYQIYNKKLEE